MSLDLEEQLVFYGAYHHNAVNVVVHQICVPVILFSAFCVASYSGTLVPLPSWLSIPYLDLNLGTLAAITWSSLYVLLEPVAGSALAVICMAGVAVCNYLRVQNPKATLVGAIALHVVSWIAQFFSHAVYEGRAPALLDNLVQSIFLAPIFVWFELLFMAGYRPELRSRVDDLVRKEIAKFQSQPSKNGKTD